MKPETETTKWRELSYHFMTEESGGEDEDTITRHGYHGDQNVSA